MTMSRACHNCAKGKRKCGRGQPRCARCVYFGLECSYPKPSVDRNSFVCVSVDDLDDCVNATSLGHHQPGIQTVIEPPSEPHNEPELVSAPGFVEPRLPLPGSIPSIPDEEPMIVPSAASLQADSPKLWFLDSSSWILHQSDFQPNFQYLDDHTCQNFLKASVDALFQWVDKGSTTFIHSRIYQPGAMPACVQEAFLATSAYRYRNPSTAPMILRVLEDKANAIVAGDTSSDGSATSSEPHSLSHLPLLEQLAHVHALLAYTMLRMVDGNIRQQHRAEKHFPVLDAWMNELRDCAEQATAGTHGMRALCEGLTPIHGSDWQCSMDIEQLWVAWAVSESIRRTWGIGKGFISVFRLLAQGNVTCDGAVGVTTLKGLWDADSAGAWARLCRPKPCGFIHRMEAAWLMETKAAEIDEFAVFTLKLLMGETAVRDWIAAG